jgi:hypothetical protein
MTKSDTSECRAHGHAFGGRVRSSTVDLERPQGIDVPISDTSLCLALGQGRM